MLRFIRYAYYWWPATVWLWIAVFMLGIGLLVLAFAK